MSTTTNTTAPTQTRLYISPLSPSLLPTVLPLSLHNTAKNISYHTHETFPENKYGYIELPTEDAQKLRKKFNGAFLKGMKVRVEEARPDKKRKTRHEELEAGDAGVGGSGEVVKEGEERKQKRAKKEKKKNGVFQAIELPEGREVKRGWVQPAGAKDEKRRSKGKEGREVKKEKKEKTEKSQMLFRTTLPPNVASKTSSKSETKSEKSGKESKEKRKGKGKGGKDVEVKEFSKSTKYPTFLRNSQVGTGGHQVTEYVDGVGWVDGEGNVVEAVSTRTTRRRVETPGFEEPEEEQPQEEASEVKTPEVETSMEAENTASAAVEVEVVLPAKAGSTSSADEEEDRSGIEEKVRSDSEDEEEDKSDIEEKDRSDNEDKNKLDMKQKDAESTPPPHETPLASSDAVVSNASTAPAQTPLSTTSPITKPTITNPPTTSTATTPPPTTAPREIHPLEALFKRAPPSASTTSTPKPTTASRPAPIVTSFSFFGNDAETDSVDQTAELIPPQTPFTQRDLLFRGQRSAAPTPDTAAVGKKMPAPWLMGDPGEQDDDEEEDDEEEDKEDEKDVAEEVDAEEDESDETLVAPAFGGSVVMPGKQGAGGEAQSDFEKHFWESRGEYNRGWKARKREARKEVRQSENRRSGVGKGL